MQQQVYKLRLLYLSNLGTPRTLVIFVSLVYHNVSALFRMVTPELCLLRFVVYDVDMFGEPNFLGHYTIPVKCALDGVRSVPLKNNFSEELELAGEL